MDGRNPLFHLALWSRPSSYLERKPANCEYENDDCDELDDSLLGLHRLQVLSGSTQRILKVNTNFIAFGT